MKKFEHILLTSDVDGTFFWEERYVNPANIERVRYFIENGGHFSFSSGRCQRDIFLIMPGVEALVNMPCVLCNGGLLYDAQKQEVIHPQYLNPKSAVRLIQGVKKRFPDVSFRISRDDGYLVSTGDEKIFADPRRQNLIAVSTFQDVSEFDGKGWYKTVFIASQPVLKEVKRFLETEGGDAFTYYYSNPEILEWLPSGITKAYQLSYLKERMRLADPEAQLWCIGDYDNDEDMLRSADVSACPSNATDAIKKIADIEVCHCRDGAVAALIDEMDRRL